MSAIADAIKALEQELPQDGSVRLLAVSKYATVDQMVQAFECGVRDFGESRVQDVAQKKEALPRAFLDAARFHFIGHLQRNKVNKGVVHQYHLIHSVDSLTLAEKLSQSLAVSGKTQSVLLQVNMTQEPQKKGFLKETLLGEFKTILELPYIDVRGLMAFGPNPPSASDSCHIFQSVKNLRDQLVERFSCPLPELSMGMSQDFHHAIQCGATIIRVGNRIFNPTPVPKES